MIVLCHYWNSFWHFSCAHVKTVSQSLHFCYKNRTSQKHMIIESRYVISSVRPPDHNVKPAVTTDLGKIQVNLVCVEQYSKLHSLPQYHMQSQSSLIPRPPHPAFVACSAKSGGRPGRIYQAAADIVFSLLTSGFVLSPSLFFPWIQFVLSVQFVLRVWLLLDRSWLATVRDVSSSTHHMINPSRPPPLSYCKRQKLGVEAWEWG